MSRLTYIPRIPTSRKVVPSKYQRARTRQARARRDLIVTWGVSVEQFHAAMTNAAESIARLVEEETSL